MSGSTNTANRDGNSLTYLLTASLSPDVQPRENRPKPSDKGVLNIVKDGAIEIAEGVVDAVKGFLAFPENLFKHITGTSRAFGDGTSWKQFGQIYHAGDSGKEIAKNVAWFPLPKFFT